MARTLPIRLRTIAAAVVVIASGLIIWNAYQSIIGSSDVTSATLPIIKADTTPFRVVPENPGGAEIPNQGSTLYNVLDADNGDDLALDGVNINQEEPETLSIVDEPLAGFELPELPEQRTESLYGILHELEEDGESDVGVTPEVEQEIEPMKVEATIALKEKLKAAIEKVEEKKVVDVQSPSPNVKEKQPVIEAISVKPSRKPVYTKPIVQKEDVNLDPSIRPVVAGTPKKRYYIQLASLRDEAQAREAYNTIRADFPNLVNGLSVSFPKVDLGSRGTFTRIQVGPLDSEKEARNRCASYNSSRGATCLVLSR